MQKRHTLLPRLALAAAIATLGASVAQASDYYAVLPMAGVDATQSSRPVTIALAGATPPPATVGVPYSFDLGALLSLDGPEGTNRANVTWSVFSGTLPAGLALAGNAITGTPTGVSAPVTVKLRAEYASGFQSVGAMLGYVFEVQPTEIMDFGAYRAWVDGAPSASCREYLHPQDQNHIYAGATGDGVYRISVAGVQIDVYCDQSSDGGGWVLLMKQAAHDGATLQGDTAYWVQGTVLNDTTTGRSMADGNFVSPAFSTLPVAGLRLQAANEAEYRYHDNAMIEPALVSFGDARRIDYSDTYGAWAPSAPNWFVHASAYPSGDRLTAARFGFNFAEYYVARAAFPCGARWGWAGNQDPADAMPTSRGSHDVCGGLGAWGSGYGGNFMNRDKSAWQPATLYLWGR